MATQQPAYQLDEKVFNRLLKTNNFQSDADFCERSGLSTRSLTTIRTGDRNITMPNVLAILDAFPFVSFDTLFKRNPEVPVYRPDENADLKIAA